MLLWRLARSQVEPFEICTKIRKKNKGITALVTIPSAWPLCRAFVSCAPFQCWPSPPVRRDQDSSPPLHRGQLRQTDSGQTWNPSSECSSCLSWTPALVSSAAQHRFSYHWSYLLQITITTTRKACPIEACAKTPVLLLFYSLKNVQSCDLLWLGGRVSTKKVFTRRDL